MKNPDIVIVDYGVGNLYNIQRAFEAIGAKVLISSNKEDIQNAPRILLPGVGAFEAGIKALKEKQLDIIVKEIAYYKKPVLGICLGMQLLASLSLENGKWDGLDLVKGKVVKFSSSINLTNEKRLKIPQIGWNSILPGKNMKNSWDETVLKNICTNPTEKPYVYFMHSYHVILDSSEYCIGESIYGADRFCSVFQVENIVGCQFHPERSGEAGLNILKNFLLMS